MSSREIDPRTTTRTTAFQLWMQAPNPMVIFIKTFDVTPLVDTARKQNLKYNMLLCHCIGCAAASVKEFYILLVGKQLMQFDCLAVTPLWPMLKAR